MRLDELTDEQLDQRLRELAPRSPRSRTWERAQRERLMHYITTGHTDAPTDPSPHTTDTDDHLVELVPERPERARSWWAMGTAAAAAVVLIIGLFVVQRVADAPASSQQPATTPAPSEQLHRDRLGARRFRSDRTGRRPTRRRPPDPVLHDVLRLHGNRWVRRATRCATVRKHAVVRAEFHPRNTCQLGIRAGSSIRNRPTRLCRCRPRSHDRGTKRRPNRLRPVVAMDWGSFTDQQAAYTIADMGGPDAPTIEYSSDYGEASMPGAGCNLPGVARGSRRRRHLVSGRPTNSTPYTDWSLSRAGERHVPVSRRHLVDMPCGPSGTRIDNPTAMTGSIDQAVADRDCRDQTNSARSETMRSSPTPTAPRPDAGATR